MNKYRTLLVREQIKEPYNSIIDADADSSKAVFNIMRAFNADLQPSESLWVVHLNSTSKCIGVEEVSRGTIGASFMAPRDVFRSAILANAYSVILVHNHPSGDVEPSKTDIKSTEEIVKAGRILGIEVLDHIIIGDGAYFSMRAGGEM